MIFYRIFLLLSALIIASCSSKYSKENHYGSSKVTEGVYLEIYKTYSGGVFSGDSYSYYLTDSVNFRKLVATTIHDDERIKRSFENGEILIMKVKVHGLNEDTLDVKKINLKEQIERGLWE